MQDKNNSQSDNVCVYYITCCRILVLDILIRIKYPNHCQLLFHTNTINRSGKDSIQQPNTNIIESNRTQICEKIKFYKNEKKGKHTLCIQYYCITSIE